MYDDFDNGDWTAGFRSRQTWVRGFFMLLFLFALWFARLLLTVVAVFQFGAQLIRRRPVARLLPLGRSLGLYLQQIAQFLTFNSEERPFPFSAWPEPGESNADYMDVAVPEDRPFEDDDQSDEPYDRQTPEPDYDELPEESGAEPEAPDDETLPEGEDRGDGDENDNDKEPPRPDA